MNSLIYKIGWFSILSISQTVGTSAKTSGSTSWELLLPIEWSFGWGWERRQADFGAISLHSLWSIHLLQAVFTSPICRVFIISDVPLLHSKSGNFVKECRLASDSSAMARTQGVLCQQTSNFPFSFPAMSIVTATFWWYAYHCLLAYFMPSFSPFLLLAPISCASHCKAKWLNVQIVPLRLLPPLPRRST